MKTFLILGVVAAAQCSPEPSGEKVEDAPVEKSDVGRADMSESDAGASDYEITKAGPAPFTVPTVRIEWPQRRATVLVPQGVRLEGIGTSAAIILGEGANFHYRVTPVASAGEAPQVEPREDGARVWQEASAWRFDVRTATDLCTNDLPGAQRHDLEDVEMMIASCRSIESAEP